MQINQPDDEGDAPLHRAVKGGHHQAVKLLLLTTGIKLNVQNNTGEMFLQEALVHQQDKIKMMLLSAGAVVNLPNNQAAEESDGDH